MRWTLALATLTLVAAAQAGDDPAARSAGRNPVDANGDGIVTREEARARWSAADKDGDGAISRQEADASLPRVALRFDQVDANRDGKVSRGEMHEFRQRERAGKSEQL